MEIIGKKSVSVKACAKINLALDVSGKGAGGYHYIDTVMLEIPLADGVTVTERADKTVTVRYKDGGSFAGDNALKAAEYIVNKYNTGGADIYIEKNIPLSAGLGGSSADTVGVVKAMSALYGFEIDEGELIKLGGDVPFMYKGGAARVGGFGEKVEKIVLPPLYVALITDTEIKSETKAVFDLYDTVGGERIDIDGFLKTLENPKNALERAAVSLEYGIMKLKILAENSGFKNVVMTGSGAGVAAYEKEKERFNEALERLEKAREKNGNIRMLFFTTEQI